MDIPSVPPVLFLGANTPWVYALAGALSKDRRVSAIAIYDRPNFRRLRPGWPAGALPANLDRTFWVFPAGYAGVLEPLLRPWFRQRVWTALRRITPTTARQRGAAPGEVPWVMVAYPWFCHSLGDPRRTRTIYYNLDDYVLYNPVRAERTLAQEAVLVAQAEWTLCLSEVQTRRLRERFPSRARRIRHFPLGVVDSFLNPAPEQPPGGSSTIGYVGNLGDRLDWALVRAVAAAMPGAEFVFAGGLEDCTGSGLRPDWLEQRTAALSLSNVRHAGKVPQEEVTAFYWQSAVNWIPYVVDHPFNQAACPTKIMDAIAAGRPVLSTDVPECRLYPDWISIAQDVNGMIHTLRTALAVNDEPDAGVRASRQVAFAREQTWAARAETLAGWLLEAGDR